MDRKTLVKRLNYHLNHLNEPEKYRKAWLEETVCDRYILRVNGHGHMDWGQCQEEIRNIISYLFKYAKEEYEAVERVSVRDYGKYFYCRPDLLVFDEDEGLTIYY